MAALDNLRDALQKYRPARVDVTSKTGKAAPPPAPNAFNESLGENNGLLMNSQPGGEAKQYSDLQAYLVGRLKGRIAAPTTPELTKSLLENPEQLEQVGMPAPRGPAGLLTPSKGGVPGAPNIRKDLAWQNLGIDDPAHRAAFEEHIGDPDKFVRDYFGGMHDPTSNLNQFVYSKSPLGKPSFDISAGLVDPNTGDPIGWTRRILKPQDGIAEHDYLKLGKSAQNTGYGKTLLQQQMNAYPDMGINKVNLFANIDVGGYAWAKYGFSPDKESWAALGKDIRQHMRGEGDFAEDLPLPGLTMDDKKAVNAILKSDPKTGMVNLSDLNTDVGAVDARGNPAPLGKALLLGKDWNGSLDLNDANQMARYNAYVGQ